MHIEITHANETRDEYEARVANGEILLYPAKRRRKTARNITDEELSRLSLHIEKITNQETGEPRLKCKMCPQSYIFVPPMMKHLEDHKKGKVKNLRECEQCGGMFKTGALLQKHRKLYHNVSSVQGIPKSTNRKRKQEAPMKLVLKKGKGSWAQLTT